MSKVASKFNSLEELEAALKEVDDNQWFTQKKSSELTEDQRWEIFNSAVVILSELDRYRKGILLGLNHDQAMILSYRDRHEYDYWHHINRFQGFSDLF